jgi:hypothetical protein
VHFAGHGGYDSEADLGYIVLCPQDGRSGYDPVNCFRFSSLMRLSESVKLVVLNNCHGAHQGLHFSQSGIAQSLSASDISAVVSMKFTISDMTAHAIVLRPSESFGIAYFQNNYSFMWSGGEPIKLIGADSLSFDKFYELWVQGGNLAKMGSVKSEVENIQVLLEKAGKLSPLDVILASRIFDDVNRAFDLLKRVNDAGITSAAFLKVCRSVVKLCQTPDEKELVQTAIVICRKDRGDLTSMVSRTLSQEFLFGDPSLIAKEASRVDGSDQAFVLLDGGGDELDASVINLKSVEPARVALCNPQWAKLCTVIGQSGCALVLPGKGRVKVLVAAGQIAEYRYATWQDYDFEKLLP